jgi:predicted nuclease of predicted toxin-antitoxin system
LRPKFIPDNDLNQDIVAGLRLREPALDFWSASEGGTRDRSDQEVLQIAAESGRILVSHDCNTMIAHFKRFIANRASPGLLIVRQRMPIGRAIDEILFLWLGSDANRWRNQVKFASPAR